MRRYEARQLARQFGWRGSKAKRQKVPTPAIQAAIRQAVRDRMAEEGDEEGK